MLVRIASAADIPDDTLKQFEADGRNFAVCNVKGEIRVFEGDCPCAGGPVGQGKMFDGVMVCPWHGMRYDVVTGACLTSPDIGLQRFAVTIQDGDVFVEC